MEILIKWDVNLDRGLKDPINHPRYEFRILDQVGLNVRRARYYEDDRRTLYKMYGIKVIKDQSTGLQLVIKNIYSM